MQKNKISNIFYFNISEKKVISDIYSNINCSVWGFCLFFCLLQGFRGGWVFLLLFCSCFCFVFAFSKYPLEIWIGYGRTPVLFLESEIFQTFSGY